MEKDATLRKAEFTKDLEPFLQMLEERSKSLTRVEWASLVISTKERIVSAPDQYLSGIIRPSEELTRAIESIFQDRLN